MQNYFIFKWCIHINSYDSLSVTFLQVWLNHDDKEDFTSRVSNEWATVNEARLCLGTTLEIAAAALRCDELYSARHLLTHLWNFSADNTNPQSRCFHNFGGVGAGGWKQVAALLKNFGYALRIRTESNGL